MQTKDGGIYRYMATSRAFLDRARSSLAAFDEQDDVDRLFVAALMLRYGIEARLFEYIEAELPVETRRHDMSRISEHAATKLLARLTRMNPRADKGTTLTMQREPDGRSFSLVYTPVTRELAGIHGRLGELLHFNYFKKNSEWYVAERAHNPAFPTLLDARDLVANGIDHLTRATSGTMLNHPVFRRQVEELIAEGESGEDAKGDSQ